MLHVSFTEPSRVITNFFRELDGGSGIAENRTKTISVLVAAERTKFGTQANNLHGGLHGTFTDLHVCAVSESTCFGFTVIFTEPSRTFTNTVFQKLPTKQ